MKYIIVGLGNFGSSLATKLTSQGHEVIGIDIDMDKVGAALQRIHFAHDLYRFYQLETPSQDYPLPKVDVVLICRWRGQRAKRDGHCLFKILMPNTSLARAIYYTAEKVLQTFAGLMISSNPKTGQQPTGQRNCR